MGVAPAELSGDTADHMDEKFQDGIDLALTEAGVEHVNLDAGWAGDCTKGPCLAEPMGAQELDFVITPTIEVDGRDFVVKLVVFGADGSVAQEGETTCEICNPDEAARAAGEEAAAIGARLEAPARAEPEPEGPEPEPAAAPPSRREIDGGTKMQYIAYGLTGAGVIGLVSGITMIALEEKAYGPKCDDTNTDSAGECEFRHKTVEGGTVLTVIGGLAAGVGVTIWVLNRKGEKNLSLAPYGRGLKLRGSF